MFCENDTFCWHSVTYDFLWVFKQFNKTEQKRCKTTWKSKNTLQLTQKRYRAGHGGHIAIWTYTNITVFLPFFFFFFFFFLKVRFAPHLGRAFLAGWNEVMYSKMYFLVSKTQKISEKHLIGLPMSILDTGAKKRWCATFLWNWHILLAFYNLRFSKSIQSVR